MTQPRYFCKACHRNWTQGGTLRNVPVGGGSRKNKRNHAGDSSSSSPAPPAPSSSSTHSKKMNLMQQLPMISTAMAPVPADLPNVLPTFMSAGGEGFKLPSSDHNSLPFPPLSLPSNPGTTTSLLDMLTGGFLDGRMGTPFLLAPPSSGAMQHGHGIMGGPTTQQLVGHLQGVDQALKLHMAGGGGSGLQQWPSSPTQGQQVVGGDEDNNKNSNNNGGGASGGSSGVEHYWHGSI